jgi:hypothetical protein
MLPMTVKSQLQISIRVSYGSMTMVHVEENDILDRALEGPKGSQSSSTEQ